MNYIEMMYIFMQNQGAIEQILDDFDVAINLNTQEYISYLLDFQEGFKRFI